MSSIGSYLGTLIHNKRGGERIYLNTVKRFNKGLEGCGTVYRLGVTSALQKPDREWKKPLLGGPDLPPKAPHWTQRYSLLLRKKEEVLPNVLISVQKGGIKPGCCRGGGELSMNKFSTFCSFSCWVGGAVLLANTKSTSPYEEGNQGVKKAARAYLTQRKIGACRRQ